MPLLIASPFISPPAPQQSVSLSATIQDVATDGNGNWVVVGFNGGNGAYYYSSDKVNWTLWGLASGTAISVDTDGLGNWVAMNSSGQIYRSTDNGQNWTFRPSPSISGATIVFYHPAAGAFIAVGNGSTNNKISTDGGDTWSALTITGASGTYKAVAVSPTRATIAGDNGVSRTSDDGTTWSSGGVPVQTIRGGDFGNGDFVFVGNSGSAYDSPTGNSSWTTTDIEAGNNNAHEFVLYLESENRWLSCNAFTDDWFESTDLSSWSPITSGDFFGNPRGNKGAVDSNGYVVVLIDGTLLVK